jgi:hypothetical protein
MSDAEQPMEIDAHLAEGEAALMLIECLMLVLIEEKIFTVERMAETIETVLATKLQMIQEGEHPKISLLATGLLRRVENSIVAARPLSPPT